MGHYVFHHYHCSRDALPYPVSSRSRVPHPHHNSAGHPRLLNVIQNVKPSNTCLLLTCSVTLVVSGRSTSRMHPTRWMISMNTVGRSPKGLVKICGSTTWKTSFSCTR